MSNITYLFGPEVKLKPSGNLNEHPSTPTMDDLLHAKDHDFRGDWMYTLRSYRSVGVTLDQINGHSVLLADIGRAITISATITQDSGAVNYFTNLITKMATSGEYFIDLRSIPNEFKGYVWSFNFQIIFNAAAFAEYQLGSIIDKRINRFVFF